MRAGDEEREELVRLLEVLQSEEIQTFIEETYEGAVVPVSDSDDEDEKESEGDIEDETDEEDTDDEEDEE